MCGIGAFISLKSTQAFIENNEWPFQCDNNDYLKEHLQRPQNPARFTKEDLFSSLQRRGPNRFDSVDYSLHDGEVTLSSAVLHLRGQSLFSQPVTVECGFGSFCYNGEIFDLRSKDVFLKSVHKHVELMMNDKYCSNLLLNFLDYIEKSPESVFHFETKWLDNTGYTNQFSDTEWILTCINEIANYCFHNDTQQTNRGQHAQYSVFDILLKCTLEQIKGPHAFMHFCPLQNRLFFMRDVLGRRSLCLNYNNVGQICIANVALGEEAIELPCNGSIILKLSKTGYHSFDFIPRTAVNDPFSSFLLAENSKEPTSMAQSNDYQNNSNFNDSDKIEEPSNSNRNSIDENASDPTSNSIHHKMLSFDNYQSIFNSSLYEAVRKRVSGHSQISVLFSGGLDSTVLAAITARVLLEENSQQLCNTEIVNTSGNHKWGRVQLINVTFDAKKGPDRNTCLLSYKDLLANFPKGTFDLILIDRNFDQIEQEQVLYLLGPNNTHMDFNISTCLWYSACGKGYLINPETMKDDTLDNLLDQAYVPEFKGPGGDKRKQLRMDMLIQSFPTFQNCFRDKLQYFQSINESQKQTNSEIPKAKIKSETGQRRKNSKEDAVKKAMNDPPSICPDLYQSKCPFVQAPSPILIMGHGADEILGGYGRHMSTFEKFGLQRLKSELWLDCNRLWTRNLGRDDRVLSDWGREARHPFLDEDFIETVTTRLPPLVDKLFLRNFAATELGLAESAARFEKRAIQFGTRLAKHSNKEKFQTNRQGRAKGTEKFIN